jgi:hypothetical protein
MHTAVCDLFPLFLCQEGAPLPLQRDDFATRFLSLPLDTAAVLD